MMKIKKTNIVLIMLIGITGICNAKSVVAMMPENGATDVNIDTHLVLTMDEETAIGNCGFISVYDHKTGKLVDRIDMSIPAGPTMPQPSNPDAVYTPIPYTYKVQHITNRNTKAGTPSGVNAWDKSNYQLDIIGGFSDGFHFYPVIAHAKQLTIYLHHNMLEYGHEYHVTIDKGVIKDFDGIKGKKGWVFRTKDMAPDSSLRQLTVAADGTGDFSTIQGAMDFIPDSLSSERERYTIYVRNGDYEELPGNEQTLRNFTHRLEDGGEVGRDDGGRRTYDVIDTPPPGEKAQIDFGQEKCEGGLIGPSEKPWKS